MMLIQDPRTTTRRSSDLSKHSADVFSEAEDHAVQITRRDGEPLVLMSQREADARASLLQFAADLITVTLDDKGTLAARMADRFPWMLALSAADQTTCAQHLVDLGGPAAKKILQFGRDRLMPPDSLEVDPTACPLR